MLLMSAVKRQQQLETVLNSSVVRFSYYRAPEVILGMSYAENVDIWSVGCIFAEMVLERTFLPGTDHIDQWTKITNELGTPSMDFINRLGRDVRAYILGRPRVPRRSFEVIFPDDAFPEPSRVSHRFWWCHDKHFCLVFCVLVVL